ncbi:MAG TPA: hypothetical protein VN577_05435 [Terriglobales bacterium]|nr:hypothetical protein [Terriglobales bacterium]
MSLTFLDEPRPITRPAGVRTLAFVCFGITLYLTANGLLIAFGVLSLASGAYLLGEYSTMGPVVFLIVSIAFVLLGFGLLRGWRWARRLAVIASGFLIAVTVVPISSAVIDTRVLAIFIHGTKIIGAIMAIRYLLQPEVVDYFTARTVPGST